MVNKLVISFVAIFLTLSSCSAFSAARKPTPESTSTATPQVVITALLALVMGRLKIVDGCPRVTGSDQDPGTALVWAPHIQVKVEPDKILVTSFNRTEDFFDGEMVSLGGGQIRPDDPLLKTVPASCKPPYWLASEIEPLRDFSILATLESIKTPTPKVTLSP